MKLEEIIDPMIFNPPKSMLKISPEDCLKSRDRDKVVVVSLIEYERFFFFAYGIGSSIVEVASDVLGESDLNSEKSSSVSS